MMSKRNQQIIRISTLLCKQVTVRIELIGSVWAVLINSGNDIEWEVEE